MSDYSHLLNRAAKLCSSGEKCTHDVRIKLIDWGLESDEAHKAINYLIENKFIDDGRFAKFYVKDKLKFNKWGKIKITYSLRQKQISSNLIEDAISAIDPQEYTEILDQLISSKIRSVGSLKTAANKAKVLRFAAQRGFSSEDIFASIARCENSSPA